MLGDRPLLPTKARTKARRKLEDLRARRAELKADHRTALARLAAAEREHNAAQAALERAGHEALAYGTEVPGAHEKRLQAAEAALRDAEADSAKHEGALAVVDDDIRRHAAAHYEPLAQEVDAFYSDRADALRRQVQAITDELAALREAAIARVDLAHAVGDAEAIRYIVHPPRDLQGLIEAGLEAQLVPAPETVTWLGDAPRPTPVMEVWTADDHAPPPVAAEQLHVWHNGERVL